MSRVRPCPSFRNLEIYHELVCKKRVQIDLARQCGLTQVRVSQIARQVKAWVDQILLPRQFRGSDGLRFHLAIAKERMRLHDAFDPLIDMTTSPDGQPKYLRKYTVVIEGQPHNTVEVSDKPDYRLLSQAIDVLGQLGQLAKIAARGPFFHLPNQVHQTVVHSTPATTAKATGNNAPAL